MAAAQRFVLIAFVACSAFALAQAQSQSQGSSATSGFRNLFSFEPMVDVGQSELGGRRVSVHVPGIFDLKLDTRSNHQGARLSQTVLSGLVKINLDRTRDPATNKTSGPIDVRVMGIPVFRNQEARNGGFSNSNSMPSMPSMDSMTNSLNSIPERFNQMSSSS